MSATPLLVTGFHRSGTSLAAMVLREAGLALGERLLAPTAHNPHGYFEDEDVVSFHDRVLAAAGHAWFLSRGPVALHDPAALDWIARYVARRAAEGSQWGFKDPRLTLTIRLWAAAMSRLNVLYVHRDPFASITSVWRRAWDGVRNAHGDVSGKHGGGLPEDGPLVRDKHLVADVYAHAASSFLSARAARRADDVWEVVTHDDVVAGRVDLVSLARERFGLTLESVPIEAILDPADLSAERDALVLDAGRTATLKRIDAAFRALARGEEPEGSDVDAAAGADPREDALTYALATSERAERTVGARIDHLAGEADVLRGELDAMQADLDSRIDRGHGAA